MQVDVRGGPGRSRGVPGSIFCRKPKEAGPKIFSQTAFRYPQKLKRWKMDGPDLYTPPLRASFEGPFPIFFFKYSYCLSNVKALLRAACTALMRFSLSYADFASRVMQ